MKIWVDDIRPAPKSYYWVKTVDLCKDLLRWHKIPSRLGTRLLDIPIHLHTVNPVGRDNMRRIIHKNGWREV